MCLTVSYRDDDDVTGIIVLVDDDFLRGGKCVSEFRATVNRVITFVLRIFENRDLLLSFVIVK